MYIYVLSSRTATDIFQFVTSPERYELTLDYPFVLRMFCQKYGGTWSDYEDLRNMYENGDYELSSKTLSELQASPIVHDDLTWIRAVPPIP